MLPAVVEAAYDVQERFRPSLIDSIHQDQPFLRKFERPTEELRAV
jgi:hypothetical protein